MCVLVCAHSTDISVVGWSTQCLWASEISFWVWEIVKRLTGRAIKALLFGSCREGTNHQSAVRHRAAAGQRHNTSASMVSFQTSNRDFTIVIMPLPSDVPCFPTVLHWLCIPLCLCFYQKNTMEPACCFSCMWVYCTFWGCTEISGGFMRVFGQVNQEKWSDMSEGQVCLPHFFRQWCVHL